MSRQHKVMPVSGYENDSGGMYKACAHDFVFIRETWQSTRKDS